MKKYIDIVEDIKNALTKISSNAHNGLQSTGFTYISAFRFGKPLSHKQVAFVKGCPNCHG